MSNTDLREEDELLLDSCTILFHSLTHTEEEIHDIGLLRGICLIFLTILLF